MEQQGYKPQEELNNLKQRFREFREQLKNLTNVDYEKQTELVLAIQSIATDVDKHKFQLSNDDQIPYKVFFEAVKTIKKTIEEAKGDTPEKLASNFQNSVKKAMEELDKQGLKADDEKDAKKGDQFADIDTAQLEEQVKKLEAVNFEPKKERNNGLLIAGIITTAIGVGLAGAAVASAVTLGISTALGIAVTAGLAAGAAIAIGVGIGMLVNYAMQQQEGPTMAKA